MAERFSRTSENTVGLANGSGGIELSHIVILKKISRILKSKKAKRLEEKSNKKGEAGDPHQ
jgi:hypothetical protein